MEGIKLKTWILGKKLGSGACSDVFAVKSASSLDSDKNHEYVIKLSPLPQIPGSKLKNKKRKKTSAERNADALYAEHLLYKNHLSALSGIPYVPNGAYGEDKGYRFLVIERLGRTLETVLQEQGPIPSITAARLGQEILVTLQQMHVKNILYVDVKPENFMLDKDKEYKVYCVDFGISDRYVLASGKHKELKQGTVVGTPTFLSLNCHNGASTYYRYNYYDKVKENMLILFSASSRRDDIESLLYVLIYMMRGNLPWQEASSDAEGARIKKSTSVTQLCASLPREWAIVLKHVRTCGFEHRPDYDFYEQQFLKLGGEKGLTTPYKWGSRFKNEAAAKCADASQESTIKSPMQKRIKKFGKDCSVSAVEPKKTAPPEKEKERSRQSRTSNGKATASPLNTSKASGADQANKEEIGVEDGNSVRPQDREVFKAVAGHAAATAAVKRMVDNDAGNVVYDLLRARKDSNNAEMHKEMLRALSFVHSDRDSAHVLQRLHAATFSLLHGRKRHEEDAQISTRRSQMRDRWRQRKPQEGATFKDVQKRCPKLFEGMSREHTQPGAASAIFVETTYKEDRAQTIPASPLVKPVATASNIPGKAELFSKLSNDTNAISDVWSGLPQATYSTRPNEQAVLRPKAALSDQSKMFRLPHENPELFGANSRSGVQQNPFLTASERLQHDRITGRARNIDNDQLRRRGKSRGPPGGYYHPVNQDVLLDKDNNRFKTGSPAVSKKFVSPINDGKMNQRIASRDVDDTIDPRLISCDHELVEKIEMEIVDNGDPTTFDDIAGLDFAKKCVNELVIWPMARPDIFTGLRSLPKGLLLFGPPGTGKTLIGKAIASQSGATFFNISASSLTSKWIGQGEKLVRTLFAVAAVKQPSVIFIDEIDSLLTQRSSEENEASRRMKTEFLVQLDGAGTKAKDIILVVGATNRPQELDEAARRRFVKRLYIPLPSFEARLDLINRLLKNNKYDLTDENKAFIAQQSKGYSGADVRALCTEAAMGPIRSCTDIRTIDAGFVRSINLDDFKEALRGVRSSVAVKDLSFYKEWNDEFGSFAFESHETS
ncbi:hypothetical protein CCR75_003678 [Bremia lactucae]|uniref:Protein kinase domain-containing protein n=1 Tax=Bremia lactucae TaxID=4779 RepID=A0A976IIS9_BRELC|nr:hypothetical protein CCR75_003678 [Bremia lactucae]